MSKVAVVYWSGTGNTELMSNIIVKEVKSKSLDIDVFTADQFSSDKVNEYEVIAFGCPSMGVEELEEDTFEPMFSEIKPQLKGKKIALFGSYGWGDGEWMRNWKEDCEEHGCILVAEPIISNEEPDDEVTEKCKELGKIISEKALVV